MPTDSPPMLVAAIDFGTTFSGWAFSFRHEYESDPLKVSAKNWTGGSLVSLKGPTCVLIRSDGKTLEKFGYEAETMYAELADAQKHTDWYFFKRFKMKLFSKEGVQRSAELEDASGDRNRKLPAKLVFALSIRYLKEDLLQMSSKRITGGGVKEKDIKWVLTVPAIWDDAAKQFMREAAVEAGIPGNQLSIALEPEAASLYCRHLPVQKGRDSLATFSTGTKYLVLDAGGGTVDITVHEVLQNGKLKELHKASGGAWGGTRVDEAYRQFLLKLLGGPVLNGLRTQHMEDYIDIFRDFEVKKRDMGPRKTEKVTIHVPATLAELYEDDTEETLKEAIPHTRFASQLQLTGDKLRMDVELVKGFFNEPIESILKHVEDLLEQPAVKDCFAIVMVGGFSESTMLQTNIRRKFPKVKVIVPEEAGLAVLKGAVIFGHCPTTIASRVSKYTYGVKCRSTFLEGFHPSSKKIKDEEDDTWRCQDSFSKLATAGQKMEIDEEVCDTFTVSRANQTQVGVEFYATTNTNPKVVDETGCRHIGEITADIPGQGRDREVKIIMKFGKTEIEASAIIVATGKATTVKLNFLD